MVVTQVSAPGWGLVVDWGPEGIVLPPLDADAEEAASFLSGEMRTAARFLLGLRAAVDLGLVSSPAELAAVVDDVDNFLYIERIPDGDGVIRTASVGLAWDKAGPGAQCVLRLLDPRAAEEAASAAEFHQDLIASARRQTTTPPPGGVVIGTSFDSGEPIALIIDWGPVPPADGASAISRPGS